MYFRSYLYRMGRATSSDCLYCVCVTDDSEHTFFRCEKRGRRRTSLVSGIGPITPFNIVVGVKRRREIRPSRSTKKSDPSRCENFGRRKMRSLFWTGVINDYRLVLRRTSTSVDRSSRKASQHLALIRNCISPPQRRNHNYFFLTL